MNVKLSRQQELYLIGLGLQKLLEINSVRPVEKKKPEVRKWTDTQHRKFKASMKKVWKKKREQAT